MPVSFNCSACEKLVTRPPSAAREGVNRYCSTSCARKGPRAAAKVAGLTHYMPDRPCMHGHKSLRRVSNGACLECDLRREDERKVNDPARHKRRYWANPEAGRSKVEAWRQANPEKRRAYDAARHHADLEGNRARSRAYRENNPGYASGNAKRWRAENPDQWRTCWQNNKAKRRGAEGSYTPNDIDAIFKAQKGKCAYCRISIKGHRHVDHIVAVTKGGSNRRSNIQLLCPACNISKHNKDPMEFARSRGKLL